MKVARVYMRVSTVEQDLERQRDLIGQAESQGYYVAAVYAEKASGTKMNRPELLRMIQELKTDEVVIAEKMDRLTRGTLEESQKLIDTIREKGAHLAIPGYLDLSEIISSSDGIAKIVLEGMERVIQRVVMQMARDDWETRHYRQMQGVEKAKSKGVYKGRPADEDLHRRIRKKLLAGYGIRETAKDTIKSKGKGAGKPVSPTTVMKIRAQMVDEGLLPATEPKIRDSLSA